MDEVRGWVFTICAGTLVCGVASALVPSKSYERTIQLLLGLFMLFCFLTPIGVQWELPQVDIEAAEQRRQEVAGQTDTLAEQQLADDFVKQATQTAARVLGEYGLEPAQYRVQVAGDAQQGYTLRLTLPDSARAHSRTIGSTLQTELGTPVELQYFGEAAQNGGDSGG